MSERERQRPRALAAAFVAAAGCAGGDSQSLEQALREAVDTVSAAHPALGLEPAAIAELLGVQLGAAEDPVQALGERSLADLVIAGACLRGNQWALEYLSEHVIGDLPRALSKLRIGRAAIDDALSQLREKLLVGRGGDPKLMAYRGTGDLKAWVKVIAVRDALRSHQRVRQHASLTDELAAALPGDDEDPELAYQRRYYAEAFRDAFSSAISGLSDRQRSLLRQAILHHSTVDEIASIYDVHRATAARWVAKAREQLARETRRHLRLRLQVSPSVLDSIARLVESHVDLSVERLLGDEEEDSGED